MKTPLKLGLLAFFALCASTLFSQSWTVAYEDDELQISVADLECQGENYLIYRLKNKTPDHITPSFQVKYNHTGVAIDQQKSGYTVPPSDVAEADCMFVENHIEMMYSLLPRIHAAEPSAVEITRL